MSKTKPVKPRAARAPAQNFRFQLKAEHQEGSTKTVCVRSVSVKGALQRLKRTFNDVQQFELVR